jgi:CRP-like cAMP-binding protein
MSEVTSFARYRSRPHSSEPHPLDGLAQRLKASLRLSIEEQGAVLALPCTVRSYRPGQVIVRERDHPSHCCLLVEGFAFRSRGTRFGTQHILSLHLPGDMPDLHSVHFGEAQESVTALTRAKVGLIPHQALHRLWASFPRLAGAFWRETAIEAVVGRERLMTFRHGTAHTRVAHLICDWATRCREAAVSAGPEFPFPLTQVRLADATALSNVHVNRVVQEFRTTGLITLSHRRVTIHDWERLVRVGEFDPSYLKAPVRLGARRDKQRPAIDVWLTAHGSAPCDGELL